MSKFSFPFSVWGTVITVVSILCCIGCWYFGNEKESERPNPYNLGTQDKQLQEVVNTNGTDTCR